MAIPPAHKIECSEIWGGNRGDQLDVETSGVRASLFSRACDGGKGGDIYYFSLCDSDLVTRIAIADVMGHGSVVSDTSQSLYDTFKRHMNSADSSVVLADLNAAAVERGHKSMTTMAVASLHRVDGTLCFSYAGHHELLVARNGSSEWNALQSEGDERRLGGIPLGVDPNARFAQGCVGLSAGDRLFLYTDGVIEAPSPDGEEFGRARLLDVLTQASDHELGQVRTRVLEALLAHTGHSMTHDDVTLIAAEIRT
jgi:sigma-B regulation protein RsbU (phosphoserine phosphatase)